MLWLDYLRQSPEALASFGAYVDAETSKAYLDVVNALPNLEAALAAKGKLRAFETLRVMVKADESERAAHARYTREQRPTAN